MIEIFVLLAVSFSVCVMVMYIRTASVERKNLLARIDYLESELVKYQDWEIRAQKIITDNEAEIEEFVRQNEISNR